MQEDNAGEQEKNSKEWLKPWQYKKGQSGNPDGRPKGSISMKTYVRNKLLTMTPEEREIFLEGVDKKTIWEMAENKPTQDLQVDADVREHIISVDE